MVVVGRVVVGGVVEMVVEGVVGMVVGMVVGWDDLGKGVVVGW